MFDGAGPKSVVLRDLKDATTDVFPSCKPLDIPAFHPAPGLSNAHVQTWAGTLFPGKSQLTGTTQRKLRLPDDDFLVLHDDRPTIWERGDHVVLMLHGLCGSHNSGYMARTAAKLHQRGVRVFRMDHRGCGAGAGLARSPYHAGRTEDLDSAIRMVERLCPSSPISIVGYSISGNLVLRYLGQYAGQTPFSLFRVVAVCPPVDLSHCVQSLGQSKFGMRYHWYFTRQLLSHVAESPLWRNDLPLATMKSLPRTLHEFDDAYTAPASGYESAQHYYEAASAIGVIPDIRVHTSILASQDDPMVRTSALQRSPLPPNVRLYVTQHGGHLGFIGRRGVDPDRRWMDWRVIDWLLQ
ncbi:MAG: alpha/beta fold hydrolase [Planctomycetaceae bacterium]|nr:alpha/beta fold hydrolase [Planctomycetaceae bacterium]